MAEGIGGERLHKGVGSTSYQLVMFQRCCLRLERSPKRQSQHESLVQQDDRGSSSAMKLTLDTTRSNAGQMEQLKILMTLLAKAQAFQEASVCVVHYYAPHEWEHDFTFESFACGKQSYMRGRGGTIQRGDHVVLRSGSHAARYQVDEIDYDAQPSDFWVALLLPCSERVVDRRFWMQPAKASCTPSG